MNSVLPNGPRMHGVTKMSTVIDFSNVADMAAVPTGEYVCVLSGIDVKDTKSGDSKYAAVAFTIADDEYEEYNGRKLFRNYSLKPDALWALKQMMIAADADPDIFTGAFDIEEEIKALFGNKVFVGVTQEEYQGEARARVGKIRAATL